MADKPVVQAVKQKGNELVKAMLDLLILALLMGGSGFGGYFLGIHERLAPVQSVPPGTANALPPAAATTAPPPKAEAKSESKAAEVADESSAKAKKAKDKYWISSSGVDYTGYSITVKINDTPVDNFFGPGKNVDITRFVKEGDNEVTFEAKALGAQYNKHPGDSASVLTVQLVSGPHVQENFEPSSVVLSYARNASESDDVSDTKHFTAK